MDEDEDAVADELEYLEELRQARLAWLVDEDGNPLYERNQDHETLSELR